VDSRCPSGERGSTTLLGARGVILEPGDVTIPGRSDWTYRNWSALDDRWRRPWILPAMKLSVTIAKRKAAGVVVQQAW